MSLIPSNIDREGILRSLNINVRDPKHQAALLICERYSLDPVLKHVVLISGNPYVTRDGLLHVAHQTGMLDGIVVEDEAETEEEWQAKVTVYVKGQTHGYSYRGRYPKDGQQKRYGPEMAVKCAEVMALRRAFGVTGIPTVEEQWDKADAIATSARPAVDRAVKRAAPRPPLPAEIAGGVSATSPQAAPSPASTKTVPGGATPAESSDSRPELNAAGDGEVTQPPTPSGPDPDDDRAWFASANRRARALAKKNLSADKEEAEAQRQALIWAASGGVSVESKDLTREQFAAMTQRLADLDEGRATLVETNDPTYLGWTLAYREVA